MKANPLYPRIVEDYKQYLRSGHVKRISFTGFCRPYNVRLKSVLQWMKRHGTDVTTLRYEALLEQGAINDLDPQSVVPWPVRARAETGQSRKPGSNKRSHRNLPRWRDRLDPANQRPGTYPFSGILQQVKRPPRCSA